MTFNPTSRSRHHKGLNESYVERIYDIGNNWKESAGIIVQVYDPEYKTKIQAASPEDGFLRVQVRISTGQLFVLPLDHSPEELYSLYGNCNNTRGMACRIRYRNQDISNGWVKISRNPQNLLSDPEDKSFVADIGSLWGAGESE